MAAQTLSSVTGESTREVEGSGCYSQGLEVVAEFLCERYPDMFHIEEVGDMRRILNSKTGESFVIGDENSAADPLETAVRLAMEDLSILLKNKEGEYYLYVFHHSTSVPD